MLKVYKTKGFAKLAKKEQLDINAIDNAVNEISRCQAIISLGGCVYKKRVARLGGGKSGGFRTIFAFKENERIIFMFGFSKSEKENISSSELEVLKRLAVYYLSASESEIKFMCKTGDLIEVA